MCFTRINPMSAKKVTAEVSRQLKQYCELKRREEEFDVTFKSAMSADLPPIRHRERRDSVAASRLKGALHERSVRRLDQGGQAQNLLTYLEQKNSLNERERYLRKALEDNLKSKSKTTPLSRKGSSSDSSRTAPVTTSTRGASASTFALASSKRSKTGKIRERLGCVPKAEAERLVTMATRLIVATDSLLCLPENNSKNAFNRVGALPLVDSDGRWRGSDEHQVEKVSLNGSACNKEPPWAHSNRKHISSSRSYSQIVNSHHHKERQGLNLRRSRSRALAPLAQLTTSESSAVSPLPSTKSVTTDSRKVPPAIAASYSTSNASVDSKSDSTVRSSSHRRKVKLRDKTAQTEMRVPDCVRGHWCIDEDKRFQDLSNERWLEDTWKRAQNKVIETPPDQEAVLLNGTNMVVFDQKFEKPTRVSSIEKTEGRHNSDTAFSETSLTSGTETGMESTCGGCSDCEGLGDSEEELLKKDNACPSTARDVPIPESCLRVDSSNKINQVVSQHSPGVLSGSSKSGADTRSLEEDSAFATDGSSLEGGDMIAQHRLPGSAAKKALSRYSTNVNYHLLRTESESKDTHARGKEKTEAVVQGAAVATDAKCPTSEEETETESGSKNNSEVFDEEGDNSESQGKGSEGSSSDESNEDDDTSSTGSTCSCDDCRTAAGDQRLDSHGSDTEDEDEECHACRVENEGCCSQSSSTASILAESAITPQQKRALSPEVIIRNPLLNALQKEEDEEKRRLDHISQQKILASQSHSESRVGLVDSITDKSLNEGSNAESSTCDIDKPGTSACTSYLSPTFDIAEIMHKTKPPRKGCQADGEEETEDDDEDVYQQLSEEEFVARLSIHEAARCGDLHVVKLLLKNNFKRMETVDERGWTPIHLAAANGHTEIVRFLAKEGAHMAALDPSGYTGIHIAAMNGHLECVEVFLENEIDVDTVTADGFTSLHLAALNDYAEICKLLLSWGASMNRQDALGRTVTDMAEEYSLERVGKLLESFHQHLESFRSVMKMLSNKQDTENSDSRLPRDILKMITTIATQEDST